MKDIPDKYTVHYDDNRYWNMPQGGTICNGCMIIRKMAEKDIQNIDTDKLAKLLPTHLYDDAEFETKLETDVANAGLRRLDLLSFYLREYPCEHWCLKDVHANHEKMTSMMLITPKIIVTPGGYTMHIRFRCVWPYFYEAHIDYDLVKKDGDHE